MRVETTTGLLEQPIPDAKEHEEISDYSMKVSQPASRENLEIALRILVNKSDALFKPGSHFHVNDNQSSTSAVHDFFCPLATTFSLFSTHMMDSGLDGRFLIFFKSKSELPQ